MPNKKITQLDQITSVTGTEQVPVQQTGIIKRTTTSAFTGRLKELARAANSVAIQDAREAGRATIIDGLSAGAVTQQDLSAVSAGLHRSPNPVTAMFVYDTSKDSDGGAWTKRCQNTSWYNEPLSGKWLGAQISETKARFESANLGTELLVNGDFSQGTTGWVIEASYSVVDNTLKINGVVANNLYQNISNLHLKYFIVEFDILSISSGVVYPRIGGQNGSSVSTVGRVRQLIQAGSTNNSIGIQCAQGTVATIDNISIKEVISTSTNAGDYYQDSTTGRFYKLNKNLLTSTATLPNQTQWLTAGTYTISSTTATSGSVDISGAATATHTAGTPTTFTVATSGNVTFTVTGSVLQAQVETGSVAYEYRANTTTRVTEVFRGNKAEFPTLSAIVAEAGKLVIYDLTESNRPMWMVYTGNIFNSGSPTEIQVLNGCMYFVYGYFQFTNFITEQTERRGASVGAFTFNSPIAQRRTGAMIATTVPYFADISAGLVSIKVAILKTSPIHPITNLLIPYIAVAGSWHTNVILPDLSGAKSSPDYVFNKIIAFNDDYLISSLSDGRILYRETPSNISGGKAIGFSYAPSYSMTILSSANMPEFLRNTTNLHAQKNRSEIAKASMMLQLLKHNKSAIGKGLAATITPTYNTGYMPGDIRRSYMTSTNQGIQTSVSGAVRSLFLKGEQGVWYDPSDLSTLFQDSAGTIPVTAVEQPVGLMLNKKATPSGWIQKIADPTLTSTSGWNNTAVFSVGKFISGNSSYTTVLPTPGRLYKYTVVVSKASTGGQAFYIGGTALSASGLSKSSAIAAGTYTGIVAATNNSSLFEFYNPGWGWNGEIDYVSVEEIAENYAFQTTALNKPTLSARYNLLTKTEDFSDLTSWANRGGSGATRTSGFTDPLGGNTAWQLVFSAANSEIGSSTGSVPINSIHSIWIKGTVGETIGSSFGGTTTLTGNWQFLSNIETSLTYAWIGTWGGATARTIQVWHPDARVANDGVGLPSYQRVNTSTDYDTIGFPKYLKFDGTKFMTAPGTANTLKFLHTSQSTVFVGASIGESTNPGISYVIFATTRATSDDIGVWFAYDDSPTMNNAYRFAMYRGSNSSYTVYATDNDIVIPMTRNPASFKTDPTNATATNRYSIRVSGNTSYSTNTYTNAVNLADSSYDLQIGQFADGTSKSKMKFYGLIIRGASTSDSQLAAVERYLDDQMTRSINNTLQITTDTLTQPNGDPIFVSIINKE